MCTRKLKRPANDAERRGHALLWRLLALVNRMNTFIHRYLHFLTVEVIDPHWHEMMTKIDQASSIDEVRASAAQPWSSCVLFAARVLFVAPALRSCLHIHCTQFSRRDARAMGAPSPQWIGSPIDRLCQVQGERDCLSCR